MGEQRYFVNPRLGLGFLALNASRPLFADVRMRRAVSYATNRSRKSWASSTGSTPPGR
jgi:ABC-type oligopeptide transport system substrate-binding subunit